MDTRASVRRINIIIGESQYDELTRRGLNISGFIRELIDDRLADDAIQIRVSKKTQQLYHKIVSNTGATDRDFEPLLVEALRKLLDERVQKIESLKDDFK